MPTTVTANEIAKIIYTANRENMLQQNPSLDPSKFPAWDDLPTESMNGLVSSTQQTLNFLGTAGISMVRN